MYNLVSVLNYLCAMCVCVSEVGLLFCCRSQQKVAFVINGDPNTRPAPRLSLGQGKTREGGESHMSADTDTPDTRGNTHTLLP